MNVSPRLAYRELHHALAVVPNVMQPCRVCGKDYTPMEALHLVCTDCFLRITRRLTFRELLIGVGLKALSNRDATGAPSTDPAPSRSRTTRWSVMQSRGR